MECQAECKMGAQLAAEALVDLGVEVIFTLSGGHITPIYQFLENTDIKLMDTRHEQAAVFMAEAYGRMTRKPGVAMVTAGPGFTNALTPIANARLSNTPLVLISGVVGIESVDKLDLQDMRQAPVIEPMVKKALVCHHPERVYEYIDMAMRIASTGRPGPVYLELPVDMLNCKPEAAKVKRLATQVECRPADLSKAPAILEMIEQANTPMIIAGSGAWYSDAGEELQKFVEMTNIPVFTATQGRGVISDEHPLCFEGSLAIRPGAAMMASFSTDLLIMLGSRFSLYYIFGDVFPPTCKIVQVDIEPQELGHNKTVDLPVTSDIKPLLAEMIRLVEEKGNGAAMQEKYAGWVKTLEQAQIDGRVEANAQWESPEAPIHPMRLAREVDNFMNLESDIVCADGGDTSVWMGMTRTVRKGGTYLDSGLYGCLGVGIPYANAAKFHNPDSRVCLITGDGSTGFNFMEFETSIRKGLPIVVVISNDLGWGMIRHSQELRLGHAIEDGTWIGRVDYHKMIEPLGGVGFLVEKPEDIRPALEEAFKTGKTCCINVMTDPTTISPGSTALANLGAYSV
ncbi:acetolactate synthase-1/2/3 large subunit [Desulfatibacillum alkenivorans DSM 16219]|uniref:Acetolactate synthase-1/2/3 large subunit n=1 Tax=Desulfatibacillum alkenivorans DSM 16219 TaxID=1121393 RepID=A0A1M6LUB9_9BACT|nr:thiamine pyrophosphate-binding protein [Desulfatibacillum alkenivorans]SHJ74781.1 acetolactate synthase-1/2/3 large subunit [Desulfatibacillum alkenivorans DSM 16219]